MTAFEIQVLSTLAIKGQDDFRIFQFASAIHQQQQKKPKTQQKTLNITLVMASAYLSILPRATICFLTVETTSST